MLQVRFARKPVQWRHRAAGDTERRQACHALGDAALLDPGLDQRIDLVGMSDPVGVASQARELPLLLLPD